MGALRINNNKEMIVLEQIKFLQFVFLDFSFFQKRNQFYFYFSEIKQSIMVQAFMLM